MDYEEYEETRIFNEIASAVEQEHLNVLVELLKACDYIDELCEGEDPRFLGEHLTLEGAFSINNVASWLILLVGGYFSANQ